MTAAGPASLKPVSGLGAKGPACFQVRMAGRTFLLDIGAAAGSDPQDVDLRRIDRPIDAILLSHQHPDHIGSLVSWDLLGRPPVFATPGVARTVAARFGIECATLAMRGRSEVGGVAVTTGANGHSPGGVWLHLHGADARLLYMGDHSTESLLFPLDAPPPAETLILDASYGVDDVVQEERRAAILGLLKEGRVLLPAPAAGRGVEFLLFIVEAGLPAPAICEKTRRQVVALIEDRDVVLRPGIAERLARALEAAVPIVRAPVRTVILGDPYLEDAASQELAAAWTAAGAPILLTGHVAKGTPAHRLREKGAAGWSRWNVHPTLSQNVALAKEVGARRVMPAFGDLRHAERWHAAFAGLEVMLSDGELALS